MGKLSSVCHMCVKDRNGKMSFGYNDPYSGFENRFFCEKCVYSWRENS